MEHINSDFGEQWFTYPRLYRMLVENCRPNGTIVELGAWKGRSSAFLVVEAKNKSPNIKIHIVDTWLGSGEHTAGMTDGLYEKFISNMAPLNGHYQSHRMTTDEAVPLFSDGSLDAVFIDADHTYEAVKRDIANWMPRFARVESWLDMITSILGRGSSKRLMNLSLAFQQWNNVGSNNADHFHNRS